jgi:hypothetical protein
MSLFLIEVKIEGNSVGSIILPQWVNSNDHEPMTRPELVESYPIAAQPGVSQNGSIRLVGLSFPFILQPKSEEFNISVNFTESS